MKKTTCYISFLLSLLLVCSLGITVFATTSTQSAADHTETVQDTNPLPDYGDMDNADEDISGVQEESDLEPQAPNAAVPILKKNSNTPLFIGAGIAVLLFVGVALYCRAKGNRPY